MAVLIVGGLLVAALVVWALTRTVEPNNTTATSTFAPVGTATTPPPPGTFASNDTSVTMPATATFPTTTMPTGTVAPPPPLPHPEGDKTAVKRIAAEDLRAQMSRNAVTVIDVRQAADYARGHIAGAINIPFASVETQFDSIPKDKPIVTYCT